MPRPETTSAPSARIVNALTGEKAPAAFFKALSEADSFCAELDELHELRTRVAELEGALELSLSQAGSDSAYLAKKIADLESSLKLARADADDAAETIALLIADRAQLIADRDMHAHLVSNIASDLADLREAHMHTVTALAQARGERDTFRARIERSGW